MLLSNLINIETHTERGSPHFAAVDTKQLCAIPDLERMKNGMSSEGLSSNTMFIQCSPRGSILY